MNPHSDEKIIDSWEKNAPQWTVAVRDGQIESRKSVTNKAIVEAVLSHSPESVVDIGCGEGWLVRELAPRVTRLVGIDAVPALIDQAKTANRAGFLSCKRSIRWLRVEIYLIPTAGAKALGLVLAPTLLIQPPGTLGHSKTG
jgi:2-polyprenyl-3-methyl-5-hydroxy-6-metoxy-1,4-benzoquinol methylase